MRFALVLCLLFFPNMMRAGVIINEIMYDLPGSDQGREWIEILNTGSEPVDLNGFNIQSVSNHKPFILISGSFVLNPGDTALIIQDFEVFSKDWPGFSGNILKSTFNLRNDSSTINLKENDRLIDTLTYFSNWGAQGDGNSLQRFGSEWAAFSPTPGKRNLKITQNRRISNTSPSSGNEKTEITVNQPELADKKSVEEPVSREEEKAYNTSFPVSEMSKDSYQSRGSLFKWLLSALGLAIVASISVIISSKKKEVKDPMDGIRIIE